MEMIDELELAFKYIAISVVPKPGGISGDHQSGTLDDD
jgi:hypothetical protein